VPTTLDSFGQGLLALDSLESDERIGTLTLAVDLSECGSVAALQCRNLGTQTCDLGVSGELLGRRGGSDDGVG
jgi:hypothetical protein